MYDLFQTTGQYLLPVPYSSTQEGATVSSADHTIGNPKPSSTNTVPSTTATVLSDHKEHINTTSDETINQPNPLTSEEPELLISTAVDKEHVSGSETAAGGQSISDMLAAVSDRVMERCGIQTDQQSPKDLDTPSLFYDQVSIVLFC